MSGWNMPAGATSDQYDDYCGCNDDRDEEEEEPEEFEPEENEVQLITEAEMLEAMAEDAGDRAYDAAEEYRLCPETIGPFPAPVVRIERAYLPPLQGELFSKEVA